MSDAGGQIAKQTLANRVIALIESARRQTVAAVNVAMVYTYYEIGRQIVEEEQGGRHHADYGKRVIADLSRALTCRYGRGYSGPNLRNMRQFYLVYSGQKICQTPSSKSGCDLPKAETRGGGCGERCRIVIGGVERVCPVFKLSWSHYLILMRLDPAMRNFYEIEASENEWSVKELERQFDSSLFERLALSRDKKKVMELSRRGQIVERPEDALKEPYVLEFTGLPELPVYSEKELETRIIDHLQEFLLEFGKGFAFVGRQVRITSQEDHFFIDLVFYNRLLRAFVLVDLKTAKLRHQDIGQMQMYVNYYDREVKLPDENPTIGLLLCADKNDFVVEYSLPKDNNQIFARQYKTVLPSKATLKRLVQRQLEGDGR